MSGMCENHDYSALQNSWPRKNAWGHWRIIPKMWQDSSPETSSTVLLTISWVPVKRWNKLGWNGSCNLAAECVAKETQAPGTAKKSKSLAITWKRDLWERHEKFYPVALPRCKRGKVQGEVRASSIVQVLLVIRWLWSGRSLLHLCTAFCCPQEVKLKPEGLQPRRETAVHPDVGPQSAQRCNSVGVIAKCCP